jgi:hypothetical protein
MALEKIPEPGDDAYENGFLNKKYATKAVKRLNRKLRVVASNFPEAAIKESEDSTLVDLTTMLGLSQAAYVIVNGELVYGCFPFRKLADPVA